MSTPYRTPAVEVPELPALRLVRSKYGPRVLAKALVWLFAALALALVAAPWVQTINGKGRVIAYAPLERQQTVEAAIEGRITTWWVQEGSTVRAGDPVVEIVDNDPSLVMRLDEERSAVRARLDAAIERTQAIESRVASLESARDRNVQAAEARVRVAEQAVQAADRAVENALEAGRVAALQRDRQRTLRQEGLSSDRTVELSEADETRTRTEVDRARAALEGARSERLAREADRLRVEADGDAVIADARAQVRIALAEQASARAELARVEVRVSRQQAQLVRAPRDGTILRLIASQGGEMVKAGDPLFVLVPTTDARAVELWVEGNDVPLISNGRVARLQFEGWPAVQFTGWPSVAVGTFAARVAFVDSTDDGRGKFRVVVVPDANQEPWPEPRFLRQGVRANGWFLLNEVRLGWELWRQFNGFPPVMDAPPVPGGSSASTYGGASSGTSYGGSR